MLNPAFWIFFAATLAFCVSSILNWKLGLLLFFTYVQFFGFLKRLILFMGLDNLSYNLLVSLQYLFLICILIGVFKARSSLPKVNSNGFMWLLLFSIVIIISLIISPFGIEVAASVIILQFLPIIILLVGQYLEPRLKKDLDSLFIKTAPIHALYQIYQFIFGPFSFELNFIENKSSIVDSGGGDFLRGIPLYDSADPLYLHFTIAFLILLKNRKNYFAFLNMLLIIVALVLIGNRSGLVLLTLAVMIWFVIDAKIAFRKVMLPTFMILLAATLNIFGYLLLDVIDTLEFISISDSDFGTRWGSIGTYTERIVGRQHASKNVTPFGLGVGSSGLAVSTLANKGIDFTPKQGNIFAHDLIGEIILDFGVAGLLVFLMLIITVYRNAIDNREAAPYAALVLASFLASALLGSSLTFGRAGYFVFLFAGYLMNKKVDSSRSPYKLEHYA